MKAQVKNFATDVHLPDGAPPRRDENTTRAAAHPELISGDFAMHPRNHVLLSAADRAAVSSWTRRMIALWVVVFVGVAGYSSLVQHHEPQAHVGAAQAPALSPTCLQWHQAASTVVARLAESTLDADLRQINDVVFRMRRARRNCAVGWVTLACQDYHAVAQNLPGRIPMYEESQSACQNFAQSGSSSRNP
jgi:hypothetical protein